MKAPNCRSICTSVRACARGGVGEKSPMRVTNSLFGRINTSIRFWPRTHWPLLTTQWPVTDHSLNTQEPIRSTLTRWTLTDCDLTLTDQWLTTHWSRTDHHSTTQCLQTNHLPLNDQSLTSDWPITDHLPTTQWPLANHLPWPTAAHWALNDRSQIDDHSLTSRWPLTDH